MTGATGPGGGPTGATGPAGPTTTGATGPTGPGEWTVVGDDLLRSMGNVVINSGNLEVTLRTVIVPNMVNAIDDTAAAAAGVPLHGLYHDAGQVRIRLA